MARTKRTTKPPAKLPTRKNVVNPFRTGKYHPSQPFVRVVRSKNKYEPLFENIPKFGPRFSMPQDAACTAASLSEMFLPDAIIDKFVESTNAYAQERLPLRRFRKVTRDEILRFISIIMYMGLVRMPCKDDYFKTNAETIWPAHKAIHLSESRFRYI